MDRNRCRRLRLLGGAQWRVRALAADCLLEATQARAERVAHLRQSLCPEHEQQDDKKEDYVDWIVDTHGVDSSGWFASIRGVFALRSDADHRLSQRDSSRGLADPQAGRVRIADT